MLFLWPYEESEEFIVEAQMEGASAKELNRTLPSALRGCRTKHRQLDPEGLSRGRRSCYDSAAGVRSYLGDSFHAEV
jgi:hypothetical protein